MYLTIKAPYKNLRKKRLLPQYFDKEEVKEIEPAYCIAFGCGKQLSLRENLFGNRCIKHLTY